MEDLKAKLQEKRLILHNLIMEIRELELQVLDEEWKDKPECPLTEEQVSNNLCAHGQTLRGIVYCKNPNCHK